MSVQIAAALIVAWTPVLIAASLAFASGSWWEGS
jgi:hypothetical protein